MKVLIEKQGSFSDNLFNALQPLEVAEYVEVCGSTKAYCQKLLTKWNKLQESPQYAVKSLLEREADQPVVKVIVQRVK